MLETALSAMSKVDRDVASAIDLVGSGSSGSKRCGSTGDLAVAGDKNSLANGDLGRVDVKVDALDVADRGVVLLSQVEEEITALDGVGLDEALRAGADGDVDELIGENEVDVLDLLVGSDEAGEGDLVVGGDVGESVTAADNVGGAGSGGTGGVGCGSRRRKAGGVVGSGASGGDAELLAGSDQVGVGDVVVAGDVADARVVEGGEAAEGLTGHDGVGNGGVGAARKCGG